MPDRSQDPVPHGGELSTDRRGKPPHIVDESRTFPLNDGRNPVNFHDRTVSEPLPRVVDSAAVDPSTDPPLDLPRAVLAETRGMVRRTPRGREAARRTRQENLAGRNKGGYSAAGPDTTSDPQLIGPLLTGYVAERGWDAPLAHARVFAEWPALVGAEVAAHCAPFSLRDGRLHIAAESTAWATQLRLLSATLLARLVAELGPDVVTTLQITGPTGPSWKHGTWSVRGSRGPRDTYG